MPSYYRTALVWCLPTGGYLYPIGTPPTLMGRCSSARGMVSQVTHPPCLFFSQNLPGQRLPTGRYLYPTSTPPTLMGGHLSAREVQPTPVSGRTGRSLPTMISCPRTDLDWTLTTGGDLYPTSTPFTLMGGHLSAREALPTSPCWEKSLWGHGRPSTAPTMPSFSQNLPGQRLPTGRYLYPTSTPLTLMGGHLSAREVRPLHWDGVRQDGNRQRHMIEQQIR